MNAIVEIDKAGRIVVPKKFRDALRLRPGTRLRAEQHGDQLTLSHAAAEARLVIENGAPLIFSADGSNSQKITVEMVNESIAQARLERERRILGLDLGLDREDE
ncbi:MAG: AbrB/MazE/SpoVT family DNA-binding domain-containing protein [Terracidiphilus sp.]